MCTRVCVNSSDHIAFTVVDGETTVTIVSNPGGTRVSGSTNTYDYPILSSVTLTCIVYPPPVAPVTYQWNTEGCYVNNRGERRCFPAGQTTQSVSEDDLIAKDAGTITCTATILGMKHTSDEFTLRISGMLFMIAILSLNNKQHIAIIHVYKWSHLLGISVTTTGPGLTPETDLVSANQLVDYSYITDDLFALDQHGVLLRCASGLGPSNHQGNVSLGGWYFNGFEVDTGNVCVFQVRSTNDAIYPGVINLYPCGPLSLDEEGIYSCMMMNSSMMVQTTRVGLYLNGRSKSLNNSPH